MPFYQRADVRIHYQEVGSGFPLMVIPGGGLNSTVAGPESHPFNPVEEFKGEYRVIAADLRNAISAALTALGLSAIGGQSWGRSRATGRGTPTPTIISA